MESSARKVFDHYVLHVESKLIMVQFLALAAGAATLVMWNSFSLCVRTLCAQTLRYSTT